MTKEFLTSKGLLTHGKSMFVISGDFGTVTLNELLEEYAQQEVAKEREREEKLVDKVNKIFLFTEIDGEVVNSFNSKEVVLNIKQALY